MKLKKKYKRRLFAHSVFQSSDPTMFKSTVSAIRTLAKWLLSVAKVKRVSFMKVIIAFTKKTL